jgi:hypothetical protein
MEPCALPSFQSAAPHPECSCARASEPGIAPELTRMVARDAPHSYRFDYPTHLVAPVGDLNPVPDLSFLLPLVLSVALIACERQRRGARILVLRLAGRARSESPALRRRAPALRLSDPERRAIAAIRGAVGFAAGRIARRAHELLARTEDRLATSTLSSGTSGPSPVR